MLLEMFNNSLYFRFPEFLRNRSGRICAEVDWKAVYGLPEADLARSVHNKELLSCDEARDTGFLRGKYFHFSNSGPFDFISFG